MQIAERRGDLLELDAALDVPADDGQPPAIEQRRRDPVRLAGNGMDFRVAQARLTEVARQTEYSHEGHGGEGSKSRH